MPPTNHDSAFVALPTRHGDVVRVLGPKPAEAAITVDPLVTLDEPLTVVRSFIGGLCDAAGTLIQPIEIELVVDPGTVVPDRQVPTGPLLAAFDACPAVRARMPMPRGFELIRQVFGEPGRFGPLIFCRESRRVLPARSPTTFAPLTRIAPDDADETTGNSDLPREMLSWDGPKTDERPEPRIYGANGGETSLGTVAALEQLLLDQAETIRRWLELCEKGDPPADRAAEMADWCAALEDVHLLDGAADGYRYALDRLVVVNAADVPACISPLGEWRLSEVGFMVGGLAPTGALSLSKREENEFETWRTRHAQQMECSGPSHLLSDETDGRGLLEVARLKLDLFAEVLEQLDAAWQAGQRPHLCWNDESVRVSWRRPDATPAVGWGFQPLLRKVGMQPNAPFDTPSGAPLAYPPLFSEPLLLPPEAVDAARYFDELRTATVFVKTVEKNRATPQVLMLVEELGVPWRLFCTGDALHVSGEGWQAILSPRAERDPNDGDGLPFVGTVSGERLNARQQYKGCEVRWYPRFGEAADLHAFGMLLFETLLSHDERSGSAFREALLAERAEISTSSMKLPVEQREDFVHHWLNERCEVDAPAAVWTRRNLLYHRDDRNRTRLDAFPATLWQAIMGYALRLVTAIPGFSFAEDRSCAAPRAAEGLLLPLAELRGLLALLDDQIFGRAAPGAILQKEIEGE